MARVVFTLEKTFSPLETMKARVVFSLENMKAKVIFSLENIQKYILEFLLR